MRQPARSTALRLLGALAVAAAGGALFAIAGAPLPWVLGAMAACAIASIAGAPIATPAAARKPMSAVIGVVLGSGFSPALIEQAGAWWVSLLALPFFLAMAAWLSIAYFRRVAKLDPATAYFAGMPGGIAEMTLMSADRGGDERVVGLIHAARIFLVVFTLPIALELFAGGVGDTAPAHAPAPGSDWSLLLWGGGTAIAGLALGRLLRLPAWPLIGPLAVSAAIHLTGISDFRIPDWALAAAQVGLGATIGCRFAGLAIRRLAHILLLATGSTAILLATTLLWAMSLGWLTGLDPVLLVLAYSPGGLAEMSMVALALALDPAAVIVHHLARVVLVLVAAPLGFGRREDAA